MSEADIAARAFRQPRATRVKNKAPASMQITAEQILREAKERMDIAPKAPKQRISSKEELDDFRLRKRQEFEDGIRKNRGNLSTYIKYGIWEEQQHDFRRARSAFERGIDIEYRNPTIWLRYAEMEMKNGHIQHARNVWDRAIALLPRVDQLWFKYAYMEEMVGNIPAARAVFERWMEWEPAELAWGAYVKMEERVQEWELVRIIYEKYVRVHNLVKTWMKYAKFEENLGETLKARAVYERAFETLPEEDIDEKLYVAFAKFEERNKETERARAIYKHALDHIPKAQAPDLYAQFTQFEKQRGDRAGIEDVILGKRRFQYEEEIKANKHNYDVWFDYIRLEEGNKDQARIREIYERAISCVPLITEKRFWQRYIFLWINYALYEELEAKDVERTRAVYGEALKIIPHNKFSFSKVWIMAAQFELRQRDLERARKMFGMAVGVAPNEKIFKAYIQLEYDLLNFDRCRMLYRKFVEHAPENVEAWMAFANFEKSLAETDRARFIFETAVDQAQLDMPEMLWKAYIDFEIEEKENARTYELFERLLDRTKHVKVWISYAQFAASVEDHERARDVFSRASEHFKDTQQKEERVMALEAWRDYEQPIDAAKAKEVADLMPRKVKSRRMVQDAEGNEMGWEEYYDYLFPDESNKQSTFKLLELARKWKAGQASDVAADVGPAPVDRPRLGPARPNPEEMDIEEAGDDE